MRNKPRFDDVVVVRWSRSSGQGAGESKEDLSGHKPSHHASVNTFKPMVKVAQWKQGTYLYGRKCLLMLFINSLHLVVMSVRVVDNHRPQCTSLDRKHPNSMLVFHTANVSHATSSQCEGPDAQHERDRFIVDVGRSPTQFWVGLPPNHHHH